MYTYCLHCFTPLGADGKCPQCGMDNASYAPKPHHLQPETILHGQYLVGQALGEGGFGITYAGFDLILRIKVAIKEYFPNGIVWRDDDCSPYVSCFTSKNQREDFELGRQKSLQEAQSLARLDDIPAVVRIRNFFSENNTAYIIMEFVDGVTLKDYAARLPQRLMLKQILDMLQPVADALDAIHARGFVHRDVSPDNIMLSPQGKVRLLDFGAVKSVMRSGGATEHPVVKRGFSALEQYSTEGQLGPWTDVYAMAATVYFLLTGTPLPEPMDRVTADPAPAALGRVLPASQQQAMLRALSNQPNLRQRSVGDLFRELRALTPPIPQTPPVDNDLTYRKAPILFIAASAMQAVLFWFGIVTDEDAVISVSALFFTILYLAFFFPCFHRYRKTHDQKILLTAVLSAVQSGAWFLGMVMALADFPLGYVIAPIWTAIACWILYRIVRRKGMLIWTVAYSLYTLILAVLLIIAAVS